MSNIVNLFLDKMRKNKLNEPVIQQFIDTYQKWISGETGKVDWNKVQPLQSADLQPYSSITKSAEMIGRDCLSKCAVVKLNGGLGTTMGCKGPKSLLELSEGKTFLDIFMDSILSLNETYHLDIPVYFMNSYNTDQETKKALSKYPQINSKTFFQHRYPRIKQDDKTPFETENTNEEWNPPGHGDVYLALQTSGLLDQLLESNIEYLFISNSDNLCALLDPKILGWMYQNKHTFVMEVAERSPSDSKGGAPILYNGQHHKLLELAQVPEAHLNQFQSLDFISIFNTNNLWVHIPTLKKLINNKTLQLDLISNPKVVHNTRIIQLETAMGSALQSFENAGIICVPRSRFYPVKDTSQLFLLKSSSVNFKNGCLYQNFNQKDFPSIQLKEPFNKVDELNQRIPNIPTIKALKSLYLKGDIVMGNNVTLKGHVSIEIPEGEKYTIPDNTTLDNVSI